MIASRLLVVRGARIGVLLFCAIVAVAGCSGDSNTTTAGTQSTRSAETATVTTETATTATTGDEFTSLPAWHAPKGINVMFWQLAIADRDDIAFTYKVPIRWNVDKSKAVSGDRAVSVYLVKAALEPSEIPVEQYARDLAGEEPIRVLRTRGAPPIFIMERNISAAPNEPDAPRNFFHDAIVSINGGIYKLEVRYPTDQDWRYGDIARAIVGTLRATVKTPVSRPEYVQVTGR